MKLFKKSVLLAMLLAGTVAMSACGKDTIKPVISGAVNLQVELNSNPDYLSGVTASDDKDGNITANIVVDSTDVNLSLLGTYELSYSVIDEGGNVDCKIVFVTVVDSTLPVFSGASNLTVEVNSDPNWLSGVTATDNYSGDITTSITVDSSAVDLSTLGTYNLIYMVADGSANENSVIVTVTVVDTTAPQIFGAVNLQVEAKSSPSWIHDISAIDNFDGNLTTSISVDSSDVDLNHLGIYDLVYSVHDSSNNENTVTVTVTVVDTTAPQILGAVNLQVEAKSNPSWIEGVTAIDNFDGDLTTSISVDSSDVDLNHVGIYDLVYTVLDSNNNENTVTVTVTVVDTTAPEILGAVNLQVEAGSSPEYLEGVTASDSCDGDLTSSITVDDSDVDLSILGIYDLIYTVEDASGNADTVTVTVTVVDTTSPEILGAVDTKVLVRSTRDWLDGVTAIDNLDGDVTTRITVNYEDVNMNVLGTYLVSYDVIDDSNNERILNINVEVVYILPQTLIDLDIALLTELKGVAPTAEELTLIQSANVLRAENYGMLFPNDWNLSPENIQANFARTLSHGEILLILDYDNFWVMSIFETSIEGVSQYDITRIYLSLLLARSLTVAESESIILCEELYNEYYLAYEFPIDGSFDFATNSEIENVIGRSLTIDEINSIATQKAINTEWMSKKVYVLIDQQTEHSLTIEEIDAIGLISNYIVTLSSGGGGLPAVGVAQTTLGVTFTSEELTAYETVKERYNEAMFIIKLSQVEEQIGREMTETEIAELRIYVAVMIEYMAKYETGVDPEFENATIAQIELIIERSLTEAEITSFEFMNTIMSIALLEEEIGRSLTETEKMAAPIIFSLEKEYELTYEAACMDPEMYTLNNSQIEYTIGRSLTQAEIDALDVFRVIWAILTADYM